MSVLVTRPSPYGEALVQLLNEHGIEAWHTPLVQFDDGRELNLLPDMLLKLNDGDLLFAVSQQAVNFAQRALLHGKHSWPKQPAYFAIGRNTAEILSHFSGQPVNYPKDREISEHLLKLSQLQDVSGRKALILRGNGGRELLAQQLTLRGVHVEFCECYQRRLIDYQSAKLIAIWQEQHIDTLIVTSAEMLQRVFTLIKEKDRPWLLGCQLVVVSERIALLARRLGWNNVKIADNADNLSLLTVFK
jgi:uroporphyrinogen-III synthase